jgi:hypothetical protein
MTTPRRNWDGTNCPDYKPRPRPRPDPKPTPKPPTPPTPVGGCTSMPHGCCPGSTIAKSKDGKNCPATGTGAKTSTTTPTPSSPSTSLKY